jgi:gas vesicle protein
MGQDPGQIREEIEDTRARMGETVGAIGYKTDVKTRAQDKVSGTIDSVKSKVGGVSDATPGRAEVKQGARRAVGVAQQNPIGLAIGSVAVGFLAGMLLPSTRVEDEKLGEASDQVTEKLKDTAQEAGERGKQVAQEAAESARESGQRHAEELKQSAQDKAAETRQSAQDNAGETGQGAQDNPAETRPGALENAGETRQNAQENAGESSQVAGA